MNDRATSPVREKCLRACSRYQTPSAREMQAIIARPLDPAFNVAPQTVDEWRTRVNAAARITIATLPQREPDP